MVSATIPKEAWRVRAGQIGARRRWGPPRVVRLDALPPDQARAIRAFLEVARSADEEAAPDVDTGAAGAEGHGSDQPTD